MTSLQIFLATSKKIFHHIIAKLDNYKKWHFREKKSDPNLDLSFWAIGLLRPQLNSKVNILYKIWNELSHMTHLISESQLENPKSTWWPPFSFDTLPFRRSFPFLSRRAGSRFSSGRFPFPAGGSGGSTAGGPGGGGPAESPDQSRNLIDGSLDGCTDAYVFNCPR